MTNDAKPTSIKKRCLRFGLPPYAWRTVIEIACYLGAVTALFIWFGGESFKYFFGTTARWFYLFSMQAFLMVWGLVLMQIVVHAIIFREWLPKENGVSVHSDSCGRWISINIYYGLGVTGGYFAGIVVFSIPVLLFTGRFFSF